MTIENCIMTKRIYLDHAATTPVHPSVVRAMRPYFDRYFGNPSSIHSHGIDARAAIETARSKVAALIGSNANEIVFTGSGTEADNLAIKGIAGSLPDRGNHIITSSIEHPAVLESCKYLQSRGFEVTYLPVDSDGLVNPKDIEEATTDRTILISIMHANNEIGTIEPVAEIGRIAKDRGIYFHCDAVQTAGHIPIDVSKLDVDLMAMSAHKLYGPKGIGALYIRKGTKIVPLIHGGAQERGLRSSTENVPAIIGFGEASSIALRELHMEMTRLTPMRDRLIAGLLQKIDGVRLNGHPSQRLPNNVSLSFKFVGGEALLRSLDRQGIAASTGSACSGGKSHASHVLLATGVPCDASNGSLRLTLGRTTTADDIERVIGILPGIIDELRE